MRWMQHGQVPEWARTTGLYVICGVYLEATEFRSTVVSRRATA